MKKRPFASLSFSASLVNGGILSCFALIPLLAFVYYRILDSNHRAPTTMDFIVGSYSPSANFSLLWFLCPIITMIILIILWREKGGSQIIVRQRSLRQIWLSHVEDLVAVSLLAAVLLHAATGIIGQVFIGVYSDFGSPTSMFSRELSGATFDGLSPAGSYALSFFYCALVLLFENALFGVLYWLARRPKAAFILLSLLNLPQVHGEASIVYDIMHNIVGGSLAVVNPLSLVYEAASVSYGSWLPGAGHGLWRLALFTLVLICLGILFDKKRDYL